MEGYVWVSTSSLKACPQSPTWELGDIAGQNGKQLCQDGKPDTIMYVYVWLRPH